MPEIKIEADIQNNSRCSGCGSRETDFRKACIRLNTHDVGKGESNQKRLHQSLNHHPDGFVVSVKITGHAKEYGGQNGFGRKALQVSIAVCNDG